MMPYSFLTNATPMEITTRDKWLSFSAGALSGLTLIFAIALVAHQFPAQFSVGLREVHCKIVAPDKQHVASLIWYTSGGVGTHHSWVVIDRADSRVDPRFSESVVFSCDGYDETIRWDGPKLHITHPLVEQDLVFSNQAGLSSDKEVVVTYSSEARTPK